MLKWLWQFFVIGFGGGCSHDWCIKKEIIHSDPRNPEFLVGITYILRCSKCGRMDTYTYHK